MTIPCNTCGHIFDNYYSLRLHLDSDAHASLTWKCERLCGRAFDTPEALAYHQSVAPLHHVLDLYVRWDPDYEEQILCCEDCDREFDNVQSLYQHLRYNSGHRMVDEQLLPYGYGERPSFRSIAESLTRLRFLEEEQEQQGRQQQERQQLVQDEHSSSHAVLPIEQASDANSAPVASPKSTHSSFTSPFESRSSIPQSLPEPHCSTASGSGFVVRAGPSSPTPGLETNIPVDTGPDHLSPWVQNLTLNDPTATSQTLDPITRQEPVGSEAISRSTNSFFPRASATLAHPSQSSQSIRSPFDNEPIPAAKFTFKLEKNKRFEHRKTLIPASPAERVARSLAKLPVPTLQEELVAMSAKMAVMELELQAAKDALKCQESQRQCVMCFERDFDSVTKCGHQFCGVCIDSWQSQHRSPWQTPCPICRKAMGKAIRVYNESSV